MTAARQRCKQPGQPAHTDRTYEEQIAHGRGTTDCGLNGLYDSKAATVKDYATTDQLVGRLGTNWFWAQLSETSDFSARAK